MPHLFTLDKKHSSVWRCLSEIVNEKSEFDETRLHVRGPETFKTEDFIHRTWFKEAKNFPMDRFRSSLEVIYNDYLEKDTTLPNYWSNWKPNCSKNYPTWWRRKCATAMTHLRRTLCRMRWSPPPRRSILPTSSLISKALILVFSSLLKYTLFY